MTTKTIQSAGKSPRSSSAILNRQYLWVVALCIAVMAVADYLRVRHVILSDDYFLPLHMLLEFSSIVVSFAVFTTGWFGYKQTSNTKDLVVGIAFLITGAIDLLHTLSYKGMPDFLGANTPGKAAAYWTVARLVASSGLLLASYIDRRTVSKWFTRDRLMIAALAIITITTGLITHFHPLSGNLFYDPDKGGLTDLKIGLEYLIIAIYLAAFFSVSEKRGWDRNTIIPLRSGLLIAMFAELAFTLYVSPYAVMNFVGHVYKSVAYYLILGALFVSSIRKPYEELSQTKEELQTLYADAKEHRREIERSFARIGTALSSSLRLEEALDQIADLAMDMLHADCSMVISLGKGGKVGPIAAQRGNCNQSERPAELTVAVGKQAAEQGKSIVYNDLRAANLATCDSSHENCLRSMACSPMIYEGEALGVVAIFSHSAGAFEDGDVKLLEAFAVHSAVAIHNAMSYERESHIADVLQRTILSPSQITSDRFEIAHVYQPAMTEALVGGDFYDVMPLPDDRIAFAIGDVSGKGLAAAVHTALAKYSLRAYIAEGHSPAEVMDLLNRTITDSTGAETFITMFLGLLDTGTGELVYTNAGHEPPLYRAGDSYRALDSTGPALGLGIYTGFDEERLILDKDSILLLYTDGVSEARKDRVLLGIERIGKELLECRGKNADETAKCIYQAALDFADGHLRDDVAILAVSTRR